MCLPSAALGIASSTSATLVALALLLAVAVAIWSVERLLRRIDRRIARVEDALEGRRAAEPPPRADAVDLAPIEGLLMDLRDAQRRLDDRLVAFAERAAREATRAVAEAPSAAAGVPTSGSDRTLLAERATNRLISLGFEDVEIVTPREEITPDGDVLVEARRHGAVHKGRVTLRAGAVVDASLRPSHGLFP